MFETSPVLMSALALRAGTDRTSLTLEQPLRAEVGTGVFHLENGRTEDGRRLRDTCRVRLEPEGREMRATLRHEVRGQSWKIAVAATATLDAGHVPGERDRTEVRGVDRPRRCRLADAVTDMHREYPPVVELALCAAP